MQGSGRVEVPTRVNPKVSRQTIHHPHLRQPSSSSSSSSTSLSLSSLSSKQLSATTASITTETCHSNHHPQRKDLILIKIVAVKMNIEHPPGLGVGYSQALKPAADILLYHPDCHSPSRVLITVITITIILVINITIISPSPSPISLFINGSISFGGHSPHSFWRIQVEF